MNLKTAPKERLLDALEAVMEEVSALRGAPDRLWVGGLYDEIADSLEDAINDALEGK